MHAEQEHTAERFPSALREDRLLTNEEAAHYIGVQPGTLMVWRSTKRVQIPFLRVGGRAVRYRQSDLDRFLDSQAVGQ